MGYYFEPKDANKSEPYKDVTQFISAKSFSSQKRYASLIKGSLSLVRKRNAKGAYPLFKKEIKPILKNLTLTEKTPWGGVSLKRVDVYKDYIQKLLVVRRFGVLGFEYHKQKHEKLRILEGKCLVFYSNHRAKDWRKGKVSWKIGTKGDRFEFFPLDEHGMIALTDSVIEETSTNHLDDLTYIYKI